MLSCCRRTGKPSVPLGSTSPICLAMLAEHQLWGSNMAEFNNIINALFIPDIAKIVFPTANDGLTLVQSVNEPDLGSTALEYQSPTNIFGTNAALFKQGASDTSEAHYSDVNQGALGNCWFMAAMQSIARYGKPDLIKSMFTARSPAGSNNPDTVTVRLYQRDTTMYGKTGGIVIQQTVSTMIPVKKSDHKTIVYARSDDLGEYWPCMLEKAAAAAATLVRNGISRSGYSALVSNMTAHGLRMFLPGFAASIKTETKTADQLFYIADTCMKQGIVVGAQFKPIASSGSAATGDPLSQWGLIASHAYSLFAIVVKNGYKLALLRNPWGKGTCTYKGTSLSGEWTGDWSDCSPQWADPANAAVKEACKFTGPRSDGMFWISFDDIAQYLQSFNIFIPDSPELRSVDLRTLPYDKANCVFTWSSWGPCSKSCGGGMQSRSPIVSVPAANGGVVCPAAQTQNCNTQPC